MPEAETAVADGPTQSPAPTIVALPSLGADMDVGTVIEWTVGIGDRVERGDVVAVVSTEKSDIDVEAWDSGWVTELIAEIDQELPVGAPLLALDQTESRVPPTPTNAPTPDRPQPEAAQPSEPTPTPAPDGPKPRSAHVDAARHGVRATPRARWLAADRGVELGDLVGSGPSGAIVAADVTEAPAVAETPPPASSAGPASAIDPMRRAIAERMTRANRDIPHYHLERDIDLSGALEWLAAHNADRPITERIVPAALLACAVARAAATVPECNGTWTDDRFEPGETVDLGLVVSLRKGGLLTPTVANADGVGVESMMEEIKAMVAAARSGQLRSRWMHPASITLTNLGDLGADRVAGIVFPPQVALIGFGRITDRPWVVDGSVVARPVVTATLSADHRASDGADGSRLLAAVANELSAPADLAS